MMEINPYDAPASADADSAHTISAPVRSRPITWSYRILAVFVAGGLSSEIAFDLSVLYAIQFGELTSGQSYAVAVTLTFVLWATFALIWIKWPWTSGMILCYIVAILVTPADPISLFFAALILWTMYLFAGIGWKLRRRQTVANAD